MEFTSVAYLHPIEALSTYLIDTDVPAANSLDPYRQIWKSAFITANGFSNTPQHAIDFAENKLDITPIICNFFTKSNIAIS